MWADNKTGPVLSEWNDAKNGEVTPDQVNTLFKQLQDLAWDSLSAQAMLKVDLDKDWKSDLDFNWDGHVDQNDFDWLNQEGLESAVEKKLAKELLEKYSKAKICMEMAKHMMRNSFDNQEIKKENKRLNEEMSTEKNDTEEIINQAPDFIKSNTVSDTSSEEVSSKISKLSSEQNINKQDFETNFNTQKTTHTQNVDAFTQFKALTWTEQKLAFNKNEDLLTKWKSSALAVKQIYMWWDEVKDTYTSVLDNSKLLTNSNLLAQKWFTEVWDLVKQSTQLTTGANTEIIKLSEDKTKHDISINTTENEISDLQGYLPQLDKAITENKSKIETFSKNIKSAETSIANLEASLKEEPNNKKLQTLLDWLIATKKLLTSNKTKLEESNSDYKELKSTLDTKILALQKKVSDSKTESDRITQRMKEITEIFQEKISKIREEIEEKHKKINSLIQTQEHFIEKIILKKVEITEFNKTLKWREKQVLGIRTTAISSYKWHENNMEITYAYDALMNLIEKSASDGDISDSKTGFAFWQESEIDQILTKQERFNKKVEKFETTNTKALEESNIFNVDEISIIKQSLRNNPSRPFLKQMNKAAESIARLVKEVEQHWISLEYNTKAQELKKRMFSSTSVSELKEINEDAKNEFQNINWTFQLEKQQRAQILQNLKDIKQIYLWMDMRKVPQEMQAKMAVVSKKLHLNTPEEYIRTNEKDQLIRKNISKKHVVETYWYLYQARGFVEMLKNKDLKSAETLINSHLNNEDNAQIIEEINSNILFTIDSIEKDENISKRGKHDWSIRSLYNNMMLQQASNNYPSEEIKISTQYKQIQFFQIIVETYKDTPIIHWEFKGLWKYGDFTMKVIWWDIQESDIQDFKTKVANENKDTVSDPTKEVCKKLENKILAQKYIPNDINIYKLIEDKFWKGVIQKDSALYANLLGFLVMAWDEDTLNTNISVLSKIYKQKQMTITQEDFEEYLSNSLTIDESLEEDLSFSEFTKIINDTFDSDYSFVPASKKSSQSREYATWITLLLEKDEGNYIKRLNSEDKQSY